MHCLGKILKRVPSIVRVHVLEVDHRDLCKLVIAALWCGTCVYLHLCSCYVERVAFLPFYRADLSLYGLTMDGVYGRK